MMKSDNGMGTSVLTGVDSTTDVHRGESMPWRVARTNQGQGPLVAIIIRPPSGWQLVNVRELWRHRELLFFLTWRDVKVRYKQTVLGAAWAVLQPAMMMVVFTVFFSRLAKVSSGDLPYPVFVYAGLLPWTFFATAISSAANSVVGSEQLISKIYFPRLIVPFAAVGAAVVDFGVAFLMLVALMLYYGIVPGISLLLVVPLVGLLTLAALGVGTLLAALNVAYRDFRYVVPFLVQIWMFATPTVYMQVAVSAEGSGNASGQVTPVLAALLGLNPLTCVVAAFRAAMLGSPYDWQSLGLSVGMVLITFIAGCLYFRRVEDHFADII
jgi:lipopolysaccharide transport system permease protein